MKTFSDVALAEVFVRFWPIVLIKNNLIYFQIPSQCTDIEDISDFVKCDIFAEVIERIYNVYYCFKMHTVISPQTFKHYSLLIYSGSSGSARNCWHCWRNAAKCSELCASVSIVSSTFPPLPATEYMPFPRNRTLSRWHGFRCKIPH